MRRTSDRFGLDMILVNVWEGADGAAEAQRYCDMWGLGATVLLDGTAEYARLTSVRGVPTNLFVDEQGIVQAVGATAVDQLLRAASVLAPELLDGPADLLRSGPLPDGFAALAADGRQHGTA